MEDPRWDHYVYSADPRTGIEASVRCAGLRTAQALAERWREQGLWRVRIVSRPAWRHKERPSYVHHGRVQRLDFCRTN